jgi:outer membrane protein assembly factor BamB
MGKTNKTFALFLLFIISMSCVTILIVKSASAQNSTNPSVSVTRTLIWNSSNNLAYSVSIAKNIIYVSTKNGSIYALDDENANVLWSFNAYSEVSSSDIQTISPFTPSLTISNEDRKSVV